MSTLAIVVIVVVVVALVAALAFFIPRARVARRQRELGQRREQAVAQRQEEADAAEQRARIASQEADRARAQADLHEHGLADDQLIEDHERERFAGTSAVPDESEEQRVESEQQPVKSDR